MTVVLNERRFQNRWRLPDFDSEQPLPIRKLEDYVRFGIVLDFTYPRPALRFDNLDQIRIEGPLSNLRGSHKSEPRCAEITVSIVPREYLVGRFENVRGDTYFVRIH